MVELNVTWLLELPLAARLVALFLLGAVIGSQVNRAAYRLAWNARPIDPWGPPDPQAPPRTWFDLVPIVGWLALRREAPLWGAGFWIRPLLVELLLGIALACLYVWNLRGGLYPPEFAEAPLDQAIVHAQFAAQALLLPFLLAASLIDADEQLIPDEVVVPGTLLGLLLSALLPAMFLPDVHQGVTLAEGWLPQLLPTVVMPLWLDRPWYSNGPSQPWPEWLNGAGGLAVALACWVAWRLALRDPVATLRHGPLKATQYWLVSLARRRGAPVYAALSLIGAAAIAGVWLLGSPHWEGLLTSLVGMIVAAGVVWVLRLVGNAALGMETLGFGDVTLMAMIGAFVGWQPALLIIFLGPLLGIGFAVANWLLTGRADICFGPFLSAAAVVVIVLWRWIWFDWAREEFLHALLMPGFTVAMVAVLLGLFAALLPLARWVRLRLYPEE